MYEPKAVQESEELIVNEALLQGLILDRSLAYCKDCGCYLKYDCADLHIQKRIGRTVKEDGSRSLSGKVVSEGLTFLSFRNYNGNIYRLCRCRKCVENKFPELKKSKFPYSSKAAKYTQYAFDVPDCDFKPVSKERQSITLDRMILKYGIEEGTNKWNSYCQKQSYTNTYEYKKEKYGMTYDLFNTYNKSRAVTKLNLINRYGETIGVEKWNNYCNRQRYTTSLEYFLETYGDKEGLKKYIAFDKARTFYGGASYIANECFTEIKLLFDKSDEIYFDDLNYEYSVQGYKIDFYNKTKNIVIEFYGDLWHCNPKLYNGNDKCPNPFKSYEDLTVGDIWNIDSYRLKFIEHYLGCKFFIIWESDWKLNKEYVIQQIKLLI